MKPPIVHIVNGMNAGGVERLCLSVVRHAPPDTQPVVISGNHQRRTLADDFASLPDTELVELSALPTERVRFVRAMYQTLRRLRPAGVICYSFGAFHLLVAVAARLAGVRGMVVSAGNTAPAAGRDRQRWRQIIGLSRPLRAAIASESFAIEASLRELGRLPTGSQAVPNGVELDRFPSRVDTGANGDSAAGPVIGMIARLDAIKDHATLLNAFQRIRAEYPTARLWLIGDGALRASLEGQAADLGITGPVTFWGNRSDIPELLARMDVFAFSTTEAEGFGIVLAEAMAVGVPIVASGVRACREVLDEGRCGLLVSPGDADALAEGLTEVLRGGPAVAERRAQARERATSLYDIRVCAASLHRMALQQGR